MLRATLTLLLAAGSIYGEGEKPLLLQKPTLSKTSIVFSYAGDLWTVGRDGGEARRLTTGPGIETDPVFSPDGSQIAFTGEYDGNTDVFTIPAGGGVPKRLTWHPEADNAVGWTVDGKAVLFRSGRNSYSRFNQLFTIPAEGGFPTTVPLPQAEAGSFSPDAARIAYTPLAPAFTIWKGYRGGRASVIWIADLSDSRIEKIPHTDSNDFQPMWAGKRVYFLSDRNGPMTLFSYDTDGKKVAQVLKNDGLDIKSASAGPGGIVYEQFGSLHLLDLKTGKEKKLAIRISDDMPEVRSHFINIGKRMQSGSLSPTGARALFEAHGEILTVPAEKGDIRNLTNTPGVHEVAPAWSPDGKSIAYFSDESGEYALHVREQNGKGEAKKIDLGKPPSFFYTAVWSPDSRKVAYVDKRGGYWYVDVEKGSPVRIDGETYFDGLSTPKWSPDSRWIVYDRSLDNRLRAVFIYSIEDGKAHQVTDGMSDARLASFDKNGKYCYFTASTDIGPSLGDDLSGFNRSVTRSVYVAVLRKDLPSPLEPESDEEKGPGARPDGAPGPMGPGEMGPGPMPPGMRPEGRRPEPVNIDFDAIEQRILVLPISPRNYRDLESGSSGIIFLTESPSGPRRAGGPEGPAGPALTLYRFDFSKRRTDKLIEGMGDLALSANGAKMLYRQGERWIVAATGGGPGGVGPGAQPSMPLAGAAAAAAAGAGSGPGGVGALKLDSAEVRVDPLVEWREMYHEVWRSQRDFFYDPGHHGLDLRAAQRKYEPYLEGVASRSDLNYLFSEMLGELRVSHLRVGGGDVPEVKHVRGGLLGADYKIENGRYRIARVYNGESWNPQLRAPLTQPGVNVAAGEYLLQVNGRELRAGENIYAAFEATAGKSVTLRVGTDANGTGAREVTVVPIESEAGLRNLAWIEENRRKVDKMTGGRVAYVYLPNTATDGYASFNRYFFAQVGKQGVVFDERFNAGGMLADYIIDYLRREKLNYGKPRDGKDFTTPHGGIYGPKVMIINEYAGSGGDAMPYYFRKTGIGRLVGKRTWGGLVRSDPAPRLIDGGFVTSPPIGLWSADGEEWVAENKGVRPDVEVEQDPAAVRAGSDPQLEKAVELVLDALKKDPPQAPRRPAFTRQKHGSGLESAKP